jgi:hypothetical protein
VDDRDEWKREKDEKFRAAFVDPPKKRFETEAVRSRKAEAKDKKAEAQAEFMKHLQAQREAKGQRQNEKAAEGKARQSKAEARTIKNGSRP